MSEKKLSEHLYDLCSDIEEIIKKTNKVRDDMNVFVDKINKIEQSENEDTQ